MRNIYLLPTCNPSRLYTNNGQLHLDSVSTQSNGHTINQNLYITSDEDIKEGDWFIANQGVHKCIEVRENNDYPFGTIDNLGYELYHSKNWNTKVILTTDSKLIAEGIQAINDEFLEWYIKNPRCEYVQTEVEFIQSPDNTKDGFYYKIIIPQDQHGQHESELNHAFITGYDMASRNVEYLKAKEIWLEQLKNNREDEKI